MDDMIVFATKNRLGCCEGSLTAFATSHYLEKYKLNRESIHKKNAWKTEGMGAAFQGLRTSPGPDFEEINARASVNGLAFAKDGKIVYSLAVESYSGMFIKNPKDDTEAEEGPKGTLVGYEGY